MPGGEYWARVLGVRIVKWRAVFLRFMKRYRKGGISARRSALGVGVVKWRAVFLRFMKRHREGGLCARRRALGT